MGNKIKGFKMKYNQKKKNLSHQINVMMERIHYTEGRRANFILIAIALLASGTTILAFTHEKFLFNAFYFILVILSSYFIFLGILIIFVYSRQINYYPWTNCSKNNKWFYRDVLKEADNFNIGLCACIFRRKKIRSKIEKEFETQYNDYKQSSDEWINDKKKDIDNDRNQIYVLHVNELYKNLYLTHLRKLTIRGIFSVLIVIVIALLFFFAFNNNFSKKTFFYCQKGKEVSFSIRPLKPLVNDTNESI